MAIKVDRIQWHEILFRQDKHGCEIRESIGQRESSEKTPLLSHSQNPNEYHKRFQNILSKGYKSLISWISWKILALLLIFALVCFGVLPSFVGGKRPTLAPTPPLNILIIGAGPAGVSSAWSLYQESKRRKINTKITMIEQNSRVGGRLQISKYLEDNLNGIPFHLEDVATSNLWDKNFVEQTKDLFGVKICEGKRTAVDVEFWNGKKRVETLKRPMEYISWYKRFKLSFKYGLLWSRKIKNLKFLSRSDESYSIDTTVDNIAQLLENLKFATFINTNAYNYVTENLGLSKTYIHNILQPQVRKQLGGQELTDVNLLAVSRALNLEDNYKCPEAGITEESFHRYLSKSNVDLKLNSRVVELNREGYGERFIWNVLYEQSGNHTQLSNYDHVIVTGPSNLIEPHKNRNHEPEEVIKYRSIWVTHFSSENKPCLPNIQKPLPEEIFLVKDTNRFREFSDIYEMSHIRDAQVTNLDTNSTVCLYQTLSGTQISDLALEEAFKFGLAKLRDFKIEKAYPLFHPKKVEIQRFKIQEGLWHTGVVESIGSEFSLSWTAGKMVGRLALDSK